MEVIVPEDLNLIDGIHTYFYYFFCIFIERKSYQVIKLSRISVVFYSYHDIKARYMQFNKLNKKKLFLEFVNGENGLPNSDTAPAANKDVIKELLESTIADSPVIINPRVISEAISMNTYALNKLYN